MTTINTTITVKDHDYVLWFDLEVELVRWREPHGEYRTEPRTKTMDCRVLTQKGEETGIDPNPFVDSWIEDNYWNLPEYAER